MQQKETIGKKCAAHELFASKERLVPTVRAREGNTCYLNCCCCGNCARLQMASNTLKPILQYSQIIVAFQMYLCFSFVQFDRL
jgi:hypothetical protein